MTSMTSMKEKTLREHMRDAAKARWKGVSAEERSAHAKRMVEAREARKSLGKDILAVADFAAQPIPKWREIDISDSARTQE